jgi:hypothetical protein
VDAANSLQGVEFDAYEIPVPAINMKVGEVGWLRREQMRRVATDFEGITLPQKAQHSKANHRLAWYLLLNHDESQSHRNTDEHLLPINPPT